MEWELGEFVLEEMVEGRVGEGTKGAFVPAFIIVRGGVFSCFVS